jgi:thiamine-phosphate pyrophosphorylase
MAASRPKHAQPASAPRLYLVTPWIEDPSALTDSLASALGAADVAALLVRLREADERTLINRVKALAPLAQAKDVAVILDGFPEIVARGGADGLHARGSEALEAALRTLKPERIVGAGELVSRHDAMSAAEAGVDYVMFGEPDAQDRRPGFEAVLERVGWWAEVFEIPCVGYATTLDEVDQLVRAGAEFIALGEAVWNASEGPVAFLTEVSKLLVAPEPTR